MSHYLHWVLFQLARASQAHSLFWLERPSGLVDHYWVFSKKILAYLFKSWFEQASLMVKSYSYLSYFYQIFLYLQLLVQLLWFMLFLIHRSYRCLIELCHAWISGLLIFSSAFVGIGDLLLLYVFALLFFCTHLGSSKFYRLIWSLPIYREYLGASKWGQAYS